MHIYNKVCQIYVRPLFCLKCQLLGGIKHLKIMVQLTLKDVPVPVSPGLLLPTEKNQIKQDGRLTIKELADSTGPDSTGQFIRFYLMS